MQPSSILSATRDLPADIESDEDLAAFAATDRRAFEALYLRHRLDVFRYARARTGDDDAAAELVSITFERALGSIARFRGGAGFRSWLFRIARNEVIDSSRRRRTAARHAPTLGMVGASQTSPEDDVLRAESIERVRTLVARLPDTQRDAILLRYAGGLTAREIAATLGRSEAATQKQLQRALATLKEAYLGTDR